MIKKKIDKRNLKTHYSLTVGNLYMRPVTKKKQPPADFEVVDGFSYEDLYSALTDKKIELIWIEGPVQTRPTL
jgi:hypothetical protein